MNSIKAMIGWSRDSKGCVTSRHIKQVSNAITSRVGGGHTGEDGLDNTTPYVIELYTTK